VTMKWKGLAAVVYVVPESQDAESTKMKGAIRRSVKTERAVGVKGVFTTMRWVQQLL
jgi:hypothetical protein